MISEQPLSAVHHDITWWAHRFLWQVQRRLVSEVAPFSSPSLNRTVRSTISMTSAATYGFWVACSHGSPSFNLHGALLLFLDAFSDLLFLTNVSQQSVIKSHAGFIVFISFWKYTSCAAFFMFKGRIIVSVIKECHTNFTANNEGRINVTSVKEYWINFIATKWYELRISFFRGT